MLVSQPPALDRKLLRYAASGGFTPVRRIDGPGWISAEIHESRSCTAPAPAVGVPDPDPPTRPAPPTP